MRAGSETSSAVPSWFVILLAVLGAAPRTAEFIRGRNLWSDEAILAGHVLRRSWSGLLQPLGDAMAPPLFLLATKASITVFGVNEHAVRLLPFLAGLAVMPAAFWTVRILFGPIPAAAALAFTAFCGPLIVYSNELRPYTLDALCVLCLVGMTRRVIAGGTRRDAVLWSITGAIALWASFAAAIAGGALLLYIALAAMIGKTRPRTLWIAAPYLMSAALLYFAVIAPARGDGETMNLMNDYYAYAGAFMPLAPRPWLVWLTYAAPNWFDTPLGWASARGGVVIALFGAALLVIGAVTAFVKRPGAAMALTFPVAAALAASALHLYPFYGRMALWTAPLAFAVAAAALMGESPKTVRRLCLVLCALTVAVPAFRAGRTVMSPSRHHDLAQVIAHIDRHGRPDDALVLGPVESVVYAFMAPHRIERDLFPSAAEAGSRAYWIPLLYDTREQLEVIRRAVTPPDPPEAAFEDAPGAAAYRYDFSKTSP